MKKYQFGFNVWGLALFLLIMIPNFIWFSVPAPHDVLRQESVTPFIDRVASICQVVMIAAICLLRRKDVRKFTIRSKWLWICMAAVIIYFICWAGYYLGVAEEFALLSLGVLPCIAFIAYEIDRKNWIALIPTLVFTVLHVIYSLLNFVI
ncbi:MAG: hypothetical protein QM697_12555 [Lachnospiraceae bacterium]